MKVLKRQCFLSFEQPDWKKDPELMVMDVILEQNKQIILQASACFPNAKSEGQSIIGRDGMTLEQVVRCAIFMRHRRCTYKELSLATADSKLCRAFTKMEYGQSFSPQALQENISKITDHVLEKMHVAICSYALELGVDDGKKVRTDSTTITTNIHHPTNAGLLWDCIRVANRLIHRSHTLINEIRCRSYAKASKKLLYKIVNTKGKDAKGKRLPLFKKMFKYHKCTENQVIEAIEVLKNYIFNNTMKEKLRQKYLRELQDLLPTMQKVYDTAYRREILNESVPVDDKIFSIFEKHTDCIAKGGRTVAFGHKVNLTAGKSNLIFDCIQERGNPSDKSYLPKAIDNLEVNFNLVPDSIATDGGYASTKNRDYALSKEVKNIVFNKIKGSMQNVASSQKMETMLKKWRSGIEALISNFKRGLNAAKCTWKGWEAFKQFVLWNIITFNLRVISRSLLAQGA
ncbi:ISNCY family transposase [Candidatus Saccharibacteria bacterium]|nr:ISNCY family transposase [Candidatus Saccharibacteria bacterium]NIW78903.1 ISNCY family transposase [Calditrichia bacterium]